jgi:MFS family permease
VAAPAPPKAFSALGLPGYRAYLATLTLTMMADNVEHVISYWVAFRQFHSPALGGFAVVSHWVPYLGFAVTVGGLNDRFDSRRLIQAGGLLFMFVSVAWGVLFWTDSLQIWHAMVLLALHGCASLLWVVSGQVLLYYIVGPEALPSAVRLSATARYLGLLVGPGVGSIMMLTLGPTLGIFCNALVYLPLVIWLVRAPYGPQFRGDRPPQRRAVRGFADIVATIREVRSIPILATMVGLAGSASFFLASGYQAQMPSFAQDLGHGDPGTSYAMLLGADASGALLGGILLESSGGVFRPRPRTAMILAIAWAVSLGGFASTRGYPSALALLFLAGFFELSFSSMTQTLVQVNAPNATRGRVLGLYNMASMGLRAFSGITVGLAGSIIGIHVSLAAAAGILILVIGALMVRARHLAVPETWHGSPVPVALATQRSRARRDGSPAAGDASGDRPR